MADQEHATPAEAALHAFIAADPVSRDLLEQIKRVAATESTVLVSGESGTGKDLVANLLHYLGKRPEQPIVKIDCASLPHELVESELFGYERSAFTGASQTKRGRLELAEQGTLVLDEVAALGLATQAKLLRVIEGRSFQRLGGTQAMHLEARIVALTNTDLRAAVANQTFREDLFYRLNVVPIELPALRDRPQDIAPIAQHFLSQLSATPSVDLRLDPEAVKTLQNYRFPGNIRELRNLMERALLVAENGYITAVSLPAEVRAVNGGPGQSMLSLAEMERKHIAEVLDHTRGKKSKAAEILGISRKNLLEKRKRYQLD
jgi:transcriptional regulator with PAS, ATPase and Fis domain